MLKNINLLDIIILSTKNPTVILWVLFEDVEVVVVLVSLFTLLFSVIFSWIEEVEFWDSSLI